MVIVGIVEHMFCVHDFNINNGVRFPRLWFKRGRETKIEKERRIGLVTSILGGQRGRERQINGWTLASLGSWCN